MRDIDREFQRCRAHIPTEPRNPGALSERDIENFSHIYQVTLLVERSAWNQAKKERVHRAGKVESIDVPSLEPFLYAAVLMRQLYGRDRLLENAVRVYLDQCGNAEVTAWISAQRDAFGAVLDGPCELLPDVQYRDLLDGILYGALLLHAPATTRRAPRALLSALLERGIPREDILYSAHSGLWHLHDRAFHIAAMIHGDVAHWCYRNRDIPSPRLVWLSSLFDGERPDGLIPSVPC